MPKSRVRSAKRRSGRKPVRKARKAKSSTLAVNDGLIFVEDERLLSGKSPKVHRFIGISLAGGKTDKTCLSILEFYPAQNKIFLSRLFDRIKTEGEISADLQIHSLIAHCQPPLESVSFDVPITLPHCLRCELTCPGMESCPQPTTQWMWKHHRSKEKKKPKKLFTPYTERCVEKYMETELEEPFHVQHALGSNLAPLTARAQYLIRRLKVPVLEVFPKVSLWRIGHALHLQKSHLRAHRHWNSGIESRQMLISRLMDRNLAFIYDQDVKVLIDNPHAFDSFLCALTGWLSFQNLCEQRPKGFPKNEGWVQIPKHQLVWA